MGAFEFERVKTHIETYLPKAPAKVIDVGGGTGKYSAWLAEKGYQVHLIEPVVKHLKTARKRANGIKNKFSIQQGISQDLQFPDCYAELIILHGPLYHLQDEEERAKSILEAKRVVKENGIILAFAINYSASTIAGLMSGLIHDKDFFDMCREELSTGIHNPPDNLPWLLAEAYYHKPAQLKRELTEQGLTYINTHAVEGIAWLDKDFFTNLQSPQKRQTLLQLNQLVETDPELLSLSPHIMCAVVKREKG